MRQIELVNGYMVCVDCRGYIDAGEIKPGCDCIPDDTSFIQEIPKHLN